MMNKKRLINLCEFCRLEIADCKSAIAFGNGTGKDNVIVCNSYTPYKAELNHANIKEVDYSCYKKECYILFYSQVKIVYKDISEKEYFNLIEAPSAGSYIHRNWKGFKKYERLQ